MPRSHMPLPLVVLVSLLSISVSPSAVAGTLDGSTIFLEARTFDARGAGATSLAVADVNGDGRPDVVIANPCVTASNCAGNGVVGVLLSNGDGTFQTAVNYPSGGYSAQSVAVGDVNGDGKPDLLVTNSCISGTDCTNGIVSVLLGNGDGTFQTAVGYASSGYYPDAVVVADVNNDGKPDAIVSNFYAGNGNYSQSTVSVLLGNGDGSFRTAVSYDPGGAFSASVAAMDVNADGKADLVVVNRCVSSANCANGTVGVLLGNGNGTFQLAVSYASGGANPTWVAVADVNGDGKPDLAVSNQCVTSANCFKEKGTVGVLINRGDGTFGSAAVFSSGAFGSNSVVVRDMNHDGKPDLVVANQCQGSVSNSTACTNGTVSVLPGNGDGSFRPPFNYVSGGSNADSIAVADVNGDGKPDVVVGNAAESQNNPATGRVGILLGNGDGTFQAAPSYSPIGQVANATAVADINGDGKADMIVANQCAIANNCASGEVSVFLGNGNGTFQSPVSYGSGGVDAVSLVVTDANADGKADLIVANQCANSTSCSSGSVAVLLNNGDGTFRPGASYSSGGPYASWLSIADVNRDGKPDVIVTGQCVDIAGCTDGAIGILLGNGDGTFRAPNVISSGGQFASSIGVADVNGDGNPDLVAVNEYAGGGILSNGTVVVLMGNGDGTFQPPATYNSGGKYAYGLAIADVNTDGKLDLLVTNQCDPTCTNGVLSVLLGNGDGTFQPTLTTTTPQTGIGALVLADFDGDGKLDVSSGAGDFLLLGNSDGTFQPPLILGGAGPGVAVGDFNRDGKPDLAVGGVILLNVSARKIATATVLVSAVNPASFNQSITFTATVTVTPQGSGTPTGTITFADGSTTLGTMSLTNGTAVFSSSVLAPGAHTITASYGGDATFASSKSSSLTQTVTKAITTTTLSSSANPCYLNQVVSFTAIVTSQNHGAVTGQITFKQGASTLGAVTLTNGQASYSTSYAITGGRSITAVYSGDGNDLTSTSPVLAQAVKSLPASTTTKVTTSGTPTFIHLPVMFKVAITSTYGLIPDGETITFYDGAAAIGTSPTARGVASFTTSSLAARTHTIKATYPGDATFTASSGTVTQVVSLYGSTASAPASSLNPSTYGQSVTLTAKVTSNAPSAPTGTMTFKNGATTLGSASLNASGVATLIKTNLPAGSLSITATYNGDTETARSTSVSLSQSVNQSNSGTTLKTSVNPSSFGQAVIFTATVTSATTVPTGSVTFLDGANALGAVALAGGKASFSTTTLSQGSHSITAVYGGTANIKGSGSSPIAQTVN